MISVNDDPVKGLMITESQHVRLFMKGHIVVIKEI